MRVKVKGYKVKYLELIAENKPAACLLQAWYSRCKPRIAGSSLTYRDENRRVYKGDSIIIRFEGS